MHQSVIFAVTAIAITLGGSTAWSTEQIGTATAVMNKVEGAIDGKPRNINITDTVFFDEHVTTGPDGATELLFKDATVLQLGPDSALTLDAFVYEPASQGAAQKMAVTLGQGTFRFVSGDMDKTAYDLGGPFGHIGVRGTSFVVNIDLVGVARIYVEEGSIVIRDKNGKETTFPTGAVVGASAMGTEISEQHTEDAAIIFAARSVLNAKMLTAGGSIPHLQTTLALKAAKSHDVYEEGCH